MTAGCAADVSGIAEGSLNLEITESAIAADAKMPQIMERIRAAGAALSIDDFGTGASTLSEFRNLPVDTVKIDKSFLARHSGIDSDSVVLSGIGSPPLVGVSLGAVSLPER